LYLRADRLYAEGSYDEASVALKEAYELSQRPALLYNLANAAERVGRYEEALNYLNQYAPQAPEHQRHIVLKRIRSLESRAEEQRHRESRGAQSSPRAAIALVPVDASDPTPDTGVHSMKSRYLLGSVIAGVGLGSVGLGTIAGLSASSTRSKAKAECVDNGGTVLCPGSAQRLFSRSRNLGLVADLAWGVGAAAIGVGLYFVLDGDSEQPSSTQLTATATANGAEVGLVAAF
jgi:tetratricopeptide (TPR) repeat protein